ncbi:MAG: translocation/assembly module TamB domain-containing protein [Chthoniobacterales bacterium]
MNQTPAVRDTAFKRAYGSGLQKFAIVILILGVIFWFIHPSIFSWVVKKNLAWWGSEKGLTATATQIHVKIGRPVLLENLHLESDGRFPSETRIDAKTVSLSLASPWSMLFGDGRLFNRIDIKNLSGAVDLRREVRPAGHSSPVETSEQQEESARTLLRYVPKQVTGESLNLQILTANQSYSFTKGRLLLSEEQSGFVSAHEISIDCGVIHQHFVDRKGITAWKDGSLYVSDLAVTNAVRIENFTADLIRAEGITLGFDLHAFGGYLRGDISFGSKEGLSFIDSAFTVNKLTLDPLPEFLGVNTILSGYLREGRFTFHGNPGNPFTAQASLRIAADRVRWNKRGWDAFTFSANLVEGKLVIPEFVLRQSENQVSLSGETTLPHHLTAAEFENVDYTVNGSGEIKDLSSLAALFGDPFQDASGRLSLQTAIKGRGSDVSGRLSLQASNLLYHGAPADSVKIETEFVQKEARITKFEVHHGKDLLQAHGSLGLPAPHNYSGEIVAKIADLSTYIGPFTTPRSVPVYGGKVDVKWQGDGTFNSHSGAFDITLGSLICRQTPAGLTGEFKGTYSPENIYFSTIALQHDFSALSFQSTFAPSGIHMQNISFTEKNQTLADGSVFIPMDASRLIKGSRWKESIIPTAQIYAKLQAHNLAIQSLGKIFGQQWPAAGTLQFGLIASGHVNAPKIQATLQGAQLTVNAGEFVLPPSSASVRFDSQDGKAATAGSFTVKGFPAVTLTASLPFHPQIENPKTFRFFDPAVPVSILLDFPKAPISILQPFLPALRNITGTLTGRIGVNNTISTPRMTGHLDITNASTEISENLPPLEKMNGLITFEDDQANLRRFVGNIGGGKFDVTGNADFKDVSNIHYGLQLRAEKILLARDPNLKLRANIDLSAAGNTRSGAVNGSIRIVDSRIAKRLEVTPLIFADTEAKAFPAHLAGRIGAPFALWTLDLMINNETPLLMADGEITPKIRIGGTLGNPLPEGEIILNNFNVFLPFSTLNIQEGHIYFNPANPGIPILDIRGTSRIQDYELHAQAFGPLTDRNLIIRSSPPLSQEALFILLSTGVAPSSGSGAVQTIIGQRGLLLLHVLGHHFENEEAESFLLNPLTAPQNQMELMRLPGQNRASNTLPFVSNRGMKNPPNSGILYNFRFQ